MAGPQRKSHPDIYTLLLAIALVAMIICVIMLYMETKDYGPNKTSGVPRVVQLAPLNTLNDSEAVCSMPSSSFYLIKTTNEMHGCSIDFAFGKLT